MPPNTFPHGIPSQPGPRTLRSGLSIWCLVLLVSLWHSVFSSSGTTLEEAINAQKRLPSITLSSQWDSLYSALSCGPLQLAFFKAQSPMVTGKISGAGHALITTERSCSKKRLTIAWCAECRSVLTSYCSILTMLTFFLVMGFGLLSH